MVKQLWPLLGAVLLGLMQTLPAQAASPRLVRIEPVGAQRGTTLDVKLHGERLADIQQVLWYDEGFAISELKSESPGVAIAKLTIAPECELGLHGFRVRTATGLSNLITFSVGALPHIAEVEPNSEFEKPQVIPLNTTVTGVIENEDVDYFQIECQAGQRINLEVEGVRLGYTFLDPYLAVLDEGRFELAQSDDAALVRQDCVCSFVAPRDGKYIVQLRECSFRGASNGFYRLHVGTFPRPTAVLPLGGQPGEKVTLRWLGDPLGERTEEVTLPTSTPRQFGLFARDDAGLAPTSNRFVVKNLPGTLEVEPNGTRAEATAVAVPGAAHGVLATQGDLDQFKFAGKKGQVLDVRVLARRLGTPLDSVLEVFKPDGGVLAGNDDNGGNPDSYVRVTLPDDGEYTLQIRDQLWAGGADFAYRIEIAPPEAALRMTLPEQVQFVDTVVPVPRGNRMAFLVGAEREEFGADVRVNFQNVPEGVQTEGDLVPAARPNIPVLFSAAADAPLDGRLVDVRGKSENPDVPLDGHLLQRTSLVRGDNNRDVWHFDTDRMAVAVTEEAPFRIEIVEPRCPLVRNGSMQLKVVAQRREGFTAPIALTFLYAPPGVGVNNSISIPEGQNEVLVPITADGNAGISTWKIALLGTATVDGGPLTVSTQLANLEVAEGFLSIAFQAATVEQGQTTDVLLKIEKRKDWEGPAKLELLGLPNEVTTEVKEITSDVTEVVFPVKTTANSPAGQHKTLFCRATVMINGEPVTHGLGGGQLRVDVPLPPKADAPPQPVAAAAPPAEKPLSRLEKLRQEQK